MRCACYFFDREMYENVELTLICMYQVAVVIKDREYVDSYMDSKPWQAGKFAHSLRMSLWREHLGLQQSEVSFSLFLSSAYDLFVLLLCAHLNLFIVLFLLHYLQMNLLIDPVCETVYKHTWRATAQVSLSFTLSGLLIPLFSYI